MMEEFVWIIICYFLGSFPIAYLVGKRADIDVGRAGAKKYSGSNVFKILGVRAGVIVGLVDILKGVLAVGAATYFQFSETGIILSALAAIAGQDWSIFTRFRGGRGLATTLGASFTISPQLEALPFLIFIFSGIIKHMGVGTIFMFGVMILSAIYVGDSLFLKFSILAFIVAMLARILAAGNQKPENFSILWRRFFFDHD